MLLNLFLTLSMQYILGPVTLVIALGAFGLSTGGLTGGVGGGGRSYDMMMTENDPIVAFQTVPLGSGGTIGGGYTLSGEETKRGQRMVCVSSDRLHHIDLRETSYIIGKDKGILTLPALSIFKNNCQACAGVGTIVPRKLCTRHLHPYSLTIGGSWLLNTNGWGIVSEGVDGGKVVSGGGDRGAEGAGGNPRGVGSGVAGGTEGFTRIESERDMLGNFDEMPDGLGLGGERVAKQRPTLSRLKPFDFGALFSLNCS